MIELAVFLKITATNDGYFTMKDRGCRDSVRRIKNYII